MIHNQMCIRDSESSEAAAEGTLLHRYMEYLLLKDDAAEEGMEFSWHDFLNSREYESAALNHEQVELCGRALRLLDDVKELSLIHILPQKRASIRLWLHIFRSP